VYTAATAAASTDKLISHFIFLLVENEKFVYHFLLRKMKLSIHQNDLNFLQFFLMMHGLFQFKNQLEAEKDIDVKIADEILLIETHVGDSCCVFNN
jgi:hypothetical protein